MDLLGLVGEQLLQPTFFYGTVLVLTAMLCSTLLIRINQSIGSRGRSIMRILPLAIPLAAIWAFPPRLYMHGPGGHPMPSVMLLDGLGGLPNVEPVLSITGLMMAVGLALALCSILTSHLFGNGLTARLMGVVNMGPEDYPELQEDIAALAKRMDIAAPRVGLTEDLRPNAFTYGTGKRTMVVFSLGILDLLDREELRAVAAHELAHVRNGDLNFKRNSQALAWLSFFNPLAYLTVRAARREREKLADQTARDFLEEKDTLLKAIEKVNAFIESTSRKKKFSASMGLAFSLSLVERTSLLSDHPSFTDRSRSYRGDDVHHTLPRAACLVLSIAVVAAMVLAVLSVEGVHAEIVHSIMTNGLGPVPPFGPGMGPGSEMLAQAHPMGPFNGTVAFHHYDGAP